MSGEYDGPALDGRAALPVPDGGFVVLGREPELVARRVRGELVLWRSAPLELVVPPGRDDLPALVWAATATVVLLGSERAVLLSLDTGEVVARYWLSFVGPPGEDHAGLSTAPDGRSLLITSTRRLWVVGPDLRAVLRHEPEGTFAGVAAWAGEAKVSVLERPPGGGQPEERVLDT